MKRFFSTAASLVLVFAIVSCATTAGSGSAAPATGNGAAQQRRAEEPSFEGEGISLAEAIEQSAEKIVADLPANSRVAIVFWESPSDSLSDYIMEELTGALVDRRMEVADRQNLEFVYRELNLHLSGEVSDASARSIGRFLGADLVITGQLIELGGPYRYRASAIHVESATRDSVTRLSVRGDAAMKRILGALANPKTAGKTAAGQGAKAPPGTAGAFLDRGITHMRLLIKV